MATSEGVGLLVSSTVLVLLVVLGPVKCVRYKHTYVCGSQFAKMYKTYCRTSAVG